MIHMLITGKERQKLSGTNGTFLDGSLCMSGDGNATRTQDIHAVTCPACLEKMTEAGAFDTLRSFYPLAYRAYMGISFSPEVRAEAIVKTYSEELDEDLKELNPVVRTIYEEKYKRFLTAWLTVKSRCLSFMITGSANFPTARNQKMNRAEQNAYEKFRTWRGSFFKKINTVRTLSPEEELDGALKELDTVKIRHDAMKRINKIFSGKGETADKLEKIKEEFGADYVQELVEDNASYMRHYGRDVWGYASFSLTNSNAKIKRLEQKLKVMQVRIKRKETFQKIEFDGGYIDIEADRVIIKHYEKPSADMISALKKRGFRWSRNHASWCRKHTGQAIIDAKNIIGV